MQKSSEIFGDSQEFMEILSQFQKILLKSSKGFKFSCETQGDNIKIEVLIQKGSVKTEDEGWISNIGNNSYSWPFGYNISYDTYIEIERRDGVRKRGRAGGWLPSWRSCDNNPYDIVKFRIVK